MDLPRLRDLLDLAEPGKRHAKGLRPAGLDHAMCFHEDLRADEWLLYDQDCPVVAGGRVLGRGNVFDRSGRHVATVAHEGLLRIEQSTTDNHDRAASGGIVPGRGS